MSYRHGSMLRKDEDMESYKNLDQMIQEVCENEDMDLNQVFDMPEDNRERIQRTEALLNLEFPEDFRHFLLKYGSGGMGSFTFMGIEAGKEDERTFTLVLVTLKYRDQGLPEYLAVIEYEGDFVTCINCEDGSIVTWSWFGKKEVCKTSDSFEAYFMEKLEDYLV